MLFEINPHYFDASEKKRDGKLEKALKAPVRSWQIIQFGGL